MAAESHLHPNARGLHEPTGAQVSNSEPNVYHLNTSELRELSSGGERTWMRKEARYLGQAAEAPDPIQKPRDTRTLQEGQVAKIRRLYRTSAVLSSKPMVSQIGLGLSLHKGQWKRGTQANDASGASPTPDRAHHQHALFIQHTRQSPHSTTVCLISERKTDHDEASRSHSPPSLLLAHILFPVLSLHRRFLLIRHFYGTLRPLPAALDVLNLPHHFCSLRRRYVGLGISFRGYILSHPSAHRHASTV